jgi:thiol-disulfide isomerase/thioredoxin
VPTTWKAILTLCGLTLVGSWPAGAGMDPVALEAAALNLRPGPPGSPREMPPFTLMALSGQAVRSADLKGKVVVLNFWATWCGPCKEEMPALDRLRRQFDARDLVVLTITTDQQRDSIQAFLKSLGLSLPVLLDESRNVSDSYLVRGLPTTFVLARDGRLVGRAVGPRVWDGPDAVALVDGLRNE